MQNLIAHATGTAHEEPTDNTLVFFIVIGASVLVVIFAGWILSRFLKDE